MNPTLAKLIETAIPVCKAQFHAAVNNSDQTPENYFSSDSLVASRRVEMWYTPHSLICLHKGKYFAVPISTCIFINFKDHEPIADGVDNATFITPKKRGRPFQAPTVE